MQYNTALGFLLLGLSLILAFKWPKLSGVFSSVALLIGFITLLEYFSTVSINIDQLFVKSYILIQSSHPGRMAPYTAFSFIFSSIAILININSTENSTLKIIAILFSLLVLVLSVIAIIGYIAHLPTAYGWGQFTTMAVHTALGFITVSLGTLMLSCRGICIDDFRLPKFLPFIVFLISGLFFFLLYQSLIEEEHHRILANISHSTTSTVKNITLSTHLISVYSVIFFITGLVLTFFLSLAIYFWLTTKKQARVLLEEIGKRDLLKSRFEIIANSANDAIIVSDYHGKIIFWNFAATHIFGFTNAEAVGKFIHEIIVPKQYVHKHMQGFQHFQETGEGNIIGRTIEITAIKKDGTEFPIEISISKMEHDGKYEASAMIRDITDRKNSEAIIHHQAYYDALTDLPNRILFSDRLETAIKQADRTSTIISLLLIDIDNFKPINDQYGHDVGDAVLKHVGMSLLNNIRKTDTAARMGGDEFTVLMTNIKDNTEVMQIAKNILDRISIPFEVNNCLINITVSIGVALYPKNVKNAQDLLIQADYAMYAAKNAGKNQITNI